MYVFQKPPALTSALCRNRVIFLAALWLTGILSGVFLAKYEYRLLFPMMLAAADDSVSIIAVVFIRTLPLIVSAFIALYISIKLIPVLAFFRALSYGFCSGLVYYFYGSAGWLFHLLMMFSGLLTNVVVLFFWLHLMVSRERISTVFFICIAITAVIIVVEVILIAPVLATLSI